MKFPCQWDIYVYYIHISGHKDTYMKNVPWSFLINTNILMVVVSSITFVANTT